MNKRDIKIAMETALKNEAKARKWRSTGGFPYWIDEDLMFRIYGDFNGTSLHFSLRLKCLPLDKMLWRVLGFTLDAFKPSLHVNGAYATHGQTIDESTVAAGASVGEVADAVRAYGDFAQSRAGQIVEMIGRDGFLPTTEALLDAFAMRFPRAQLDMSVEKVLWYLMHKDYAQAEAIILPKIAEKKTGGFFVEKTFYQRALDYLEAESKLVS